jgi:hypothetical protein
MSALHVGEDIPGAAAQEFIGHLPADAFRIRA